MGGRIIGSIFWMILGTGLGYGLLLVVPPNEKYIKQDLPGLEKSPSESIKKKRQFADVLQTAAGSSHPLYRLNKEGIEKEMKKE